MDDVRTPMYAAEPYQESQGRDSPGAASPDALMAFYKDMEQKEIVERKLSKRRSNSIWSRKSVKRSTAPAVPPASLPSEAQDERRRGEEEREMERLEEQKDTVPQVLNSPRSIIPDTAKAWSAVTLPALKLKYNIHNPVGPRWYKNHHLIPPSHIRSATRPPSVFSPSFPPMASSALQDRSEDATRMPGPSRTPSNSPLPTPNSSQTRVEDSGTKARSRKSSQTAHDNVDLLDVTDPWGTNWHHHSPYDIGLGNGPISADVQDALQTRTRRSSMTTAQSRRKTVTPSPLSQSTSAVHLHDLDVGGHIPRKLSKRRTPALVNIFGGQTQQSERNAVSLPVTPVEHTSVPRSSSALPKRMSVSPPDPTLHPNGMASRKEKRGSVLGRLVKKFSILRKPATDQRRISGREDDWQHVSTDDAGVDEAKRRPVMGRQVFPEKDQHDTTRRIPPPSSAIPSPVNQTVPDADRSSSISFEAPFAIGRLTITNPDAPGLSDNTPAQDAVPLLPDKLETKERARPSLQMSPGNSSPVDSDLDFAPSAPPHTSVSSVILSSEAPPPVAPGKTPVSLPRISGGGREMGSSEAPSMIMSIGSLRPPSLDFSSEPPEKLKAASTISNHVIRSSLVDVQPAEFRSTAQLPSIVDLPLKQVLLAESNPANNYQPFYRPLAKLRSSSPPPSLPFPTTETTDPQFLSPDSFASYDYSPLSATSMLANPPTPYTADLSMPPSPEPLPPPLPPTSQDRKRSSREPSPTSHMGRQTETFKLVRSSSGNVYASSETIVAGGQQWEVVESLENKSKGRVSSKANDRETGIRRDQRREGRHTTETDAEVEERYRVRSRRGRKSQLGEHAASNSMTPIADNTIEHPGISRVVRKKEDGGRPSDRKRSTTNLDVNKPQPPPPPRTPGAPPARQLERQPSTSARPTSELPSAAEMNALRAKEAWDMERLWKARSVYGNDSHGFAATTVPLTAKDEKSAHAAIHGSSHTAFVVQSPFQTQPPHIYHSMPDIPPTVLYSSPSIPSSPQSFPSSQHRSSKQLFQNFDQMSASATPHLPLTNPLPEPPRASSYEPAALSF